MKYVSLVGHVLSLSGLLFGIIMHLFVNSKAIKRQTQIETKVDESIIHSGEANHFKNSEGVGGKLYLLTDKLQFKSHTLIFRITNLRFR